MGEKITINATGRLLYRFLIFIASRRYESYKITIANYNIISVGEWLIGIPGLERGTRQHMNKIASEVKN